MTREFTTINPATEEVIDRYEIMTKEQINEKTKKARIAFDEWKTELDKRIDHIHDFATGTKKEQGRTCKDCNKRNGKGNKRSKI